jgi:ElaB/YqjD/DUF883 family membrane-anchored ribosome-binding protein
MLEALPNNTNDPDASEPEARSPVSPPVQGNAPAWEDPEEHATPSDPLPVQLTTGDVHGHTHGLTLERGGRGGMMAGTAERIGSAVGACQRQVRRGLELVRRPNGGTIEFPSSGASSTAERANQLVREEAERASRWGQRSGDEVVEIRRQTAQKMDKWSEVAGERFQEFRRELSSAVSTYRERAQQLAEKYPLQTIAAIAGAGFALGVALRIRRSYRG